MYIMIMIIIIIIIIYTEKAHTVKVNVRCWTGGDTNRYCITQQVTFKAAFEGIKCNR